MSIKNKLAMSALFSASIALTAVAISVPVTAVVLGPLAFACLTAGLAICDKSCITTDKTDKREICIEFSEHSNSEKIDIEVKRKTVLHHFNHNKKEAEHYKNKSDKNEGHGLPSHSHTA